MIRSITTEEIPTLVQVHLEVLPNSIQAKFGRRFVLVFYKSLLSDTEFYCDGFFWDSQLIGFVSYSPRPWKVFRSILRKKFWSFSSAIFLGIACKPKRLFLLAKVIPVFFRWRAEPRKEDEAEGINWGVLPGYRRSSQFYKQKGVHVAGEIFIHFVEAVKGLGVKRIKIMPTAGDPATTGFLEKYNWEFAGKINRWGEVLDVYVKNLQ